MKGTIIAAQHAAAVLTRDQSPKGRGGYQTLFYTHDSLSQDDIRVIERRVQYRSDGGEKAKWQYFRLTDKRPVITRLVPIHEPDEFGRRGRFLAHSLIFNTADLQALDDAPFDLLQPEYFLSSFEKVLALDELRSGKIGKTSIAASMEWDAEALDALRRWSGEPLERFVRLIVNQQQITEQGRYVAFLGNESEVLGAMKIAFLLAPASVRKAFSFDTNADGCEWQRDASFWGRGFSTPDATNSGFVVNIVQREVQLSGTAFPSTPYGNWVGAVVKEGKFTVLDGNLERAQSLSALVEGQPPNRFSLKDRDEELENTFAEANSKLIAGRVTEFLPGQFSPALSQAVIAQISKTPKKMLRWLLEGSQRGISFREPVYQSLLHTPGLTLTATDLEILKPLSKGHSELGLMLALKSGDERGKLQMLREWPPNEYQACVKKFQKHAVFEAWQFFSPHHLGSWLCLFQGVYKAEDIFKAISTVVEHGSKKDQQQLAEITYHLDQKEKHELQNWLGNTDYDLPKLKLALAGRHESDSVLSRLTKIFTRNRN